MRHRSHPAVSAGRTLGAWKRRPAHTAASWYHVGRWLGGGVLHRALLRIGARLVASVCVGERRRDDDAGDQAGVIAQRGGAGYYGLGGVPTQTPPAQAPAPPGPAEAPAPGTPALAPPGPAPAPEPPGPAVVAPPGPVSGPPPPGPAGVVAAGAVVVTLAGVVTVVVTVDVVGFLLLLFELHPAVNELRAIAAAMPAATETRRAVPLPVMSTPISMRGDVLNPVTHSGRKSIAPRGRVGGRSQPGGALVSAKRHGLTQTPTGAFLLARALQRAGRRKQPAGV